MPLLKKDALKELRKRKVIIIRGRGGSDLHVSNIYTPFVFEYDYSRYCENEFR